MSARSLFLARRFGDGCFWGATWGRYIDVVRKVLYVDIPGLPGVTFRKNLQFTRKALDINRPFTKPANIMNHNT